MEEKLKEIEARIAAEEKAMKHLEAVATGKEKDPRYTHDPSEASRDLMYANIRRADLCNERDALITQIARQAVTGPDNPTLDWVKATSERNARRVADSIRAINSYKAQALGLDLYAQHKRKMAEEAAEAERHKQYEAEKADQELRGKFIAQAHEILAAQQAEREAAEEGHRRREAEEREQAERQRRAV